MHSVIEENDFWEVIGKLKKAGAEAFEALMDRYPPFSQDPRYPECRNVIHAFIELCRGRAVYSIAPDRVAGIWVARIR